MKNRGITLIALTITIIILLILAGITIGTLTGDNGLIKNAEKAKEQEEIDSEKEILETATIQAMEKDRYGNIVQSNLQNVLEINVGKEEIIVYDEENNFVVEFIKSKRFYNIDKDGNAIRPVEIKMDTTPGKLDGSGTKEDPFVIMSIEDLVYFSQSVDCFQAYNGEYVVLGKTLDFKSKLSYVDYATIQYDEYLGGNGTTGLMEQLSENGKGFLPIGCTKSNDTRNFSGIFDGQGYEIKNIYEKSETGMLGGLFSNVLSATIKNVKVTGKFYSDNNSYGGIVGLATSSYIYNCCSNVEINGIRTAGICCISKESYFVNCCNKGNISGKWQTGVGGIVGECQGNNNYIYNSFNLGIIELVNGQADASSGGIAGNTNNSSVNINNCYNIGKVTSSWYAGGIIGGINNIVLDNCYYVDNNDKGIGSMELDSAIQITLNQIQNKEKIEQSYIIDKLNEYVSQYNNANSANENFIELKYWKIEENGYPTFR